MTAMEFPVGMRVRCSETVDGGIVVEGDEQTIFAQYGFRVEPGISLDEYRDRLERCTVRGMPMEFEDEPVDPELFVAVLTDGGETWWVEKRECVAVTN